MPLSAWPGYLGDDTGLNSPRTESGRLLRGGDLGWRADRHLIIKTDIFMFVWRYLNYHYKSNKSVKINNSDDQDNANKYTQGRDRGLLFKK